MRKLLVLIVLIGIVTMLGGCAKKQKNTYADIIPLGAQPKEQIVEAYGVIRSSEVKSVTIDFTASVEEVLVKNGQKVKKGDPLMKLNIEDYTAMIKDKESDLNLLKEMNKDTDIQDEKITAVEESLKLLKENLTTDNINQDLVISDMDNGLVFDIAQVEGDMVYSGWRLVSIANLDSILVYANVDQQFGSWVKLGAEVDITPEYDKNKVYKGKVSFISSKAFQNNGETNIPVEITFDEPIEGLLIDSDVQVKIYPVK